MTGSRFAEMKATLDALLAHPHGSVERGRLERELQRLIQGPAVVVRDHAKAAAKDED